MTTFQKSIIGIGVVIIVLLGVIVYGLFRGMPEGGISSQDSTIVQKSVKDDQIVKEGSGSTSDLEKYEYILTKPGEYTSEKFGITDQKLIQKNTNTGEEKVLVESIKETIPELQDGHGKGYYVLHEIGKNEEYLFFQAILTRDGPIVGYGEVYEFNMLTNNLLRVENVETLPEDVQDNIRVEVIAL